MVGSTRPTIVVDQLIVKPVISEHGQPVQQMHRRGTLQPCASPITMPQGSRRLYAQEDQHHRAHFGSAVLAQAILSLKPFCHSFLRVVGSVASHGRQISPSLSPGFPSQVSAPYPHQVCLPSFPAMALVAEESGEVPQSKGFVGEAFQSGST